MVRGKMESVKVPGENKKHRVFMYALSTCAWCKLTKQFLKDGNIEYEYVDVDLCSIKERESVRKDIQSRGGEPIYPTLIIDDKILITGFRKDEIRKVLGI